MTLRTLEEESIQPSTQLQPTDILGISFGPEKNRWCIGSTPFFPSWMGVMLNEERRGGIDRLNRAGITYFQPYVGPFLRPVDASQDRIKIFKKIERFIFSSYFA